MGTPSSILLQLQTQLKNSSNLSYVNDNHILLGVRDNITNFPCIYIEPLRMDDEDLYYTKQDLYFHVMVVGMIKSTGSKDDLVADSSNKGIVNVENDIKNAIEDDRTLNGECMHVSYNETIYDIANWPIRSVGIELIIRFRQTSNTRT